MFVSILTHVCRNSLNCNGFGKLSYKWRYKSRQSTIINSTVILTLINYSRSSYPTRAPYSGQVDGFRNPMKKELKTTARLVIMRRSNRNFNFGHLTIFCARGVGNLTLASVGWGKLNRKCQVSNEFFFGRRSC